MNEIQFSKAISETTTFKSFEKFKQGLTLRAANIRRLYDKYQQGKKYGIEYLKQNPNIYANDIKLIDEVIQNEL